MRRDTLRDVDITPPDSPTTGSRTGLGPWLLLLVFIFTVWNPANLALRAAAASGNLQSRSAPWLLTLALRIGIAGLGMAAGRALWQRRPGAVSLAKAALVLSAAELILRLWTRIDVAATPPGTRLPLGVFVVLHAAAWCSYLAISRRVRAIYGLESQP